MKAVNLIPAEQRGGASVGAGRSEGAVYAVLGLFAGLALLAFLYGTADHKIASSKVRVATLEARAQRAQAQAGALAPYTSFIALREQRVQEVSQLVNSRFDWAHSFHELGRVLPRGATISSLTGTIGAATATAPAAPAPAAAPAAGSTSPTSAGAATSVASATPPGSVPSFALSGCATSQSEVALTLNRLRLIDGVSDVTLQSSAKGGSTSGGSGGCSAKNPVFTVQVAFDPLPATPAPGTASTATAAATSTGAAQPTTPTGGAR